MSAPVLLRCAAALALGAGAGYAASCRISVRPPYLEIKTFRSLHTENYDLWDLRVTARCGETIEHVRVEPQSPRLHLVGPGTFDGLKSGWTKTFRLQLDDPADDAVLGVRVSQEGPVSSTYDLSVGGPR